MKKIRIIFDTVKELKDITDKVIEVSKKTQSEYKKVLKDSNIQYIELDDYGSVAINISNLTETQFHVIKNKDNTDFYNQLESLGLEIIDEQ